MWLISDSKVLQAMLCCKGCIKLCSSFREIFGGNVLRHSVIQSGLINECGGVFNGFVNEVANGFASLGNGCLC